MIGITFDVLALLGAVIVLITSLVLLISSNWRWSISGLAIQYVGVFFLVISEWRMPMAATTVLAGWVSAMVLGTAISGLPQENKEMGETASRVNYSTNRTRITPISATLFRLMAAGVVGLAVFSVINKVVDWIPGIELEQSLGALFLIAFGLLHLGLNDQPLRVVLGLLTVFSGFEIFYATVEVSALVAGLLAAVTLGLALVGAYLLVAPTMEGTS